MRTNSAPRGWLRIVGPGAYETRFVTCIGYRDSTAFPYRSPIVGRNV